MANKPKNQEAQPQLQPGDPLFNLKHAQAESELSASTGGLGPTNNEYVSTDEDEELAVVHIEVDALDDLGAAITLADAAQ